MYCENCGKEIEDNSVFCPECGMRIKVVRSKSSKKNSIGGRKKKGIIVVTLLVCILFCVNAMFKVVKNKEYKKYMDLGEQYLTEYQYEDAINSFEKAIKCNSMEIEPYWNRAKAYKEMGDTVRAGQAYSQVINCLINKAVREKKTPKDTEEICKEVMDFWGNLDTIQQEEKLIEIEYILSKIEPYIDDSIREELYLEKLIYKHNGMASHQIKGTYLAETNKSYGQASAGTTQYTIDELYKKGVVFYEKGDFDADGKKDMIIVYSDVDENGAFGLTASFYSSEQNQYYDCKYSLMDIKSANFYFFVKNNYFVMVEQEDESKGFLDAVYYPVLNEAEEYEKSTYNHFTEKICVRNLGEQFTTVCEFERVIDDSSGDNHTSKSELKEDENKSAFSKGYTSYGWPSDTEVIWDEEEMNRRVLSILSTYEIDNINLQNITWNDRKTALAVETNSSIENITKILFSSSEGSLDESDENNIKVTGTFTMDVTNT